MAVNHFDPNIEAITDPIELDKSIEEIRAALSAIPWLTKAFGRSYLSYKKVGNRVEFFPQVYQGDGEDLLNVMCNDNLNAYCFFKVNDPGTYVEFNKHTYSRICYNVSIIFWIDFSKLGLTYNHPENELVKRDVNRVLNSLVLSNHNSFDLELVYEDPKNVWSDYTLDLIKDNFRAYPYHSIRFQGKLCYLENC